MNWTTLQTIANARYAEPMSSWPEHNRNHSRTLMGVPLFDGTCLRCHLESAAFEHLKSPPEEHKKENG